MSLNTGIFLFSAAKAANYFHLLFLSCPPPENSNKLVPLFYWCRSSIGAAKAANGFASLIYLALLL